MATGNPTSTTVAGGKTTITVGGDPSTNSGANEAADPTGTAKVQAAAAKAQAASTAASSTPYNHDIFLVLAIELLAVGLFTLLAGVSQNVGRLMVIVMVALWLIYFVTTSSVITKVGGALAKVSNEAST